MAHSYFIDPDDPDLVIAFEVAHLYTAYYGPKQATIAPQDLKWVVQFDTKVLGKVPVHSSSREGVQADVVAAARIFKQHVIEHYPEKVPPTFVAPEPPKTEEPPTRKG